MLCFESDKLVVQILGGVSLCYMVGMHLLVILVFPDEREQLCLCHLAVLLAPTHPRQETAQGEGKGKEAQVREQEDLRLTKLPLAARWLPILFKQITPSKRRMLMLENGPQAAMALIYLLLEAGSLPVAIMNLALPLAQILLGRIAFYPTLMSRIVIEHVAQRLARAIEDENWPLAKHIARDCLLWADLHVLRRVLRSCPPWQQLLPEDDSERSEEEDRAMLEAAQIWIKYLICGIKGKLHFRECCLRDVHGRILGILIQRGRVEFPVHSTTSLCLQDNSFGPDGLRAIIDGLIQSQTNFHVLDLSHCADYDGIKRGLCDAELWKLPVLHLILDENKLRSLGAQEIARTLIQHNDHNLRQLSLRGNGIGDLGAEAIANSLQHWNLDHLDLQSNNIGDPGAQALARNLTKGCILRWLGVQDNYIGGHGIQELLQAKERLKYSSYREDPGSRGHFFGARLYTSEHNLRDMKLQLDLDPQKHPQ